MILYRVKQFYWGINSKVSKEDKDFINKYLDKDELNLFNKLKVYDQTHSIRTARDVKAAYSDYNIEIEEYTFVKVALLHDIGKIEKSLNLIEKSIIVLLDKFTKGKIKNFSKSKKIDIYYNHGEKGYDILKNYIDNKKILDLIRNHHSNDIKYDKELEILKMCDSKN